MIKADGITPECCKASEGTVDTDIAMITVPTGGEIQERREVKEYLY